MSDNCDPGPPVTFLLGTKVVFGIIIVVIVFAILNFLVGEYYPPPPGPFLFPGGPA